MGEQQTTIRINVKNNNWIDCFDFKCLYVKVQTVKLGSDNFMKNNCKLRLKGIKRGSQYM